jgi:glycosyltransferase involved in cell wall biosynthesis
MSKPLISTYIDTKRWCLDNLIFELSKRLTEFNFTMKHGEWGEADLYFTSMVFPEGNCPGKHAMHAYGLHERTIEEYLNLLSKPNIAGISAEYMIDRVKGLTDTPIRYLPFGIDTELFKPVEVKNDVFTLGWVGRPTRPKIDYKRLSVIREAVSGLGVNFKTFENPYGRGRLPYEDMPKFYQGLDAYVCYSSEEGFGMPLLEAAACGLPLITTDVGCVRHLKEGAIIVDSEQGLKEAVAKLKDDKDLREDLGEKARASAVNVFAWEKIALIYEKFFKEALSL